MTYSNTGIWLFSLVIFGFACNHAGPAPNTDALQEKAAPYDLFSFQRSYPDRSFDWQGWRKTISRLRSDFRKTHNYGASPENNATDWTLQGPGNVAGRVNALAIKPGDDSTLLAGFSGGGIFKSTDAGANWKPVFDDQMELAIGDITYDPTNPDIVYAGTGDPNIPAITFNGNGLFKSADGGETWQYLALSQTGIISKVIVDPTNPSILYVAAMGTPYVRDEHRGVYKSTDGGLSWQKVLFVSEQAGASDLVIDPVNPLILYASFWDRIRSNQESTIYGPHARVYKTTDGGATWAQLGGGLPTGILGRTGLAISQQNPEKVYAVYIDSLSTVGGLYKSTDGGATWTSLNTIALEDACGNFGWYFGKIRLNPLNDEEVYFLAIVLWRKSAGSTQWQVAANSHADCHDLVFGTTGRRYLGTDGGVYRNEPGQMPWYKSNNLPTTQFYHTSYNPHEPNTYFAGAQDNGIRKGNGNGYNTWASVFPADGFRCAFDPNDPNIFWVETQNGEIHKTLNGGNDWIYGSPCLGTNDRCNWDLPYVMSPHLGGRLYAGTYRMYFSENGSGWGPISGDLTDGIIFGERFHNISCVDESPVQEGKLLAGTSDGNVWRREPAGNWANLTPGLPDRYVTAVITSPTLPERMFVTQSGFRDNEYIPHVHRSDNNGQSWTDISGNLPNMPVNDLLALPGHADSVLFVATDAGVYFTLNAGTHWQRLGSNLPFIPVFDLERNPVRNELIAATHARGLWTFPIDSVFTQPPASTIAVAGIIRTEEGAGIGAVTVCQQPLQNTGSDGAYELLFGNTCLATGIFPERNDTPLNGISTFDLVLINKHILGLEALNSPYKLIAADANNSRSVTTFDIVILRKLILGIDTVFSNTSSWRFIPADYDFPDPENPFSEVFPEGVTPILPAQAPQPLVIDFVGVKTGDVNGSAIPGVSGPADDREISEWPFPMQDQFVRPNDPVNIVFYANWEVMAGLQFTLEYESQALEFQSVVPLIAGIGIDNFGVRPSGKNCITVSADNPRARNSAGLLSSAGSPPLFSIRFRAKEAGFIRNNLHLATKPTSAAVFNAAGKQYCPVLRWELATPAPTQAVFFPNPFGQAGVRCRIDTDGQATGTIRIFDARGKIVFQQQPAQQELYIPGAVFPVKGTYWYTLDQGSKRQNGKLVYLGE